MNERSHEKNNEQGHQVRKEQPARKQPDPQTARQAGRTALQGPARNIGRTAIRGDRNR